MRKWLDGFGCLAWDKQKEKLTYDYYYTPFWKRYGRSGNVIKKVR